MTPEEQADLSQRIWRAANRILESLIDDIANKRKLDNPEYLYNLQNDIEVYIQEDILNRELGVTFFGPEVQEENPERWEDINAFLAKPPDSVEDIAQWIERKRQKIRQERREKIAKRRQQEG